MTHQIELGSTVYDSFSVYEADFYTRKTGETSFTSVLYKNGVVSAIPVTIAEIGTSGEYKVSFTPDSIGIWKVLVLVDFDKNWWEVSADVSYTATPSSLNAEAFINVAFDDAIPRLYMETWLERSNVKVPLVDLISCQVKLYDMAGATIFTATSSSPKADGHFSMYQGLSLTADRPYNLEVTIVDTTGTVVTNHAFTTVG